MGRIFESIDILGILLLILLGSFGLFLLLTIQKDLFYQQFLYLIAGLVILIFVSRTDSLLLWWFAPYGYILANVFLFLSYFGPEIRGATRWIFIGPLQLQPSELVKPVLLLGYARFIAQYSPRQLKYLPLHLILFIVPFLLVFKQPDVGSSIVYFATWIAMMIAGGLSVSLVVLAGVLGFLFLPLGWNALAQYQKNRILTFINPALDPRGAGYNALQSMITVGSGQFLGRGLGRGTQSHLRFLPEYHTDFIFATLVEELGFVGGTLLLIIYGLLLGKILLAVYKDRGRNNFFLIYGLGLFTIILTQIFINAGMNMGLIPITGITLPFVSYGGSSILSLTVAFGVFWAITRSKTLIDTVAFK